MSLERDAKFLKVSLEPRYWEDAFLNGAPDREGHMPLRSLDEWVAVIELDTGRVLEWPMGCQANLQYKVCDSGLYWLLNQDMTEIARWTGVYVPSDYLCTGRSGTGDYLGIEIGSQGLIRNWTNPGIDSARWAGICP